MAIITQVFVKLEEWRTSLATTVGAESWLTEYYTLRSLVKIRENTRDAQELKARLEALGLSERARQLWESDRTKARTRLQRGRDFDPKF